MALALETFLTALYVIVDAVYQRHIRPQMPAGGGPPALDERPRGALPGSGGPMAQRRAVAKRARYHPLVQQTPAAVFSRPCSRRVPSTVAADACGERASCGGAGLPRRGARGSRTDCGRAGRDHRKMGVGGWRSACGLLLVRSWFFPQVSRPPGQAVGEASIIIKGVQAAEEPRRGVDGEHRGGGQGSHPRIAAVLQRAIGL